MYLALQVFRLILCVVCVLLVVFCVHMFVFLYIGKDKWPIQPWLITRAGLNYPSINSIVWFNGTVFQNPGTFYSVTWELKVSTAVDRPLMTANPATLTNYTHVTCKSSSHVLATCCKQKDLAIAANRKGLQQKSSIYTGQHHQKGLVMPD